jgi:hypothetical protein
MSSTWGERSWDDEAAAGEQRSDFFNMRENKSYSLRICSKPFAFATHWLEDPVLGKKKVNCAGKDCVLCSKGFKANARYFVAVIVREEGNRVAITEFGPMVYNRIRALHIHPKWGNPVQYDIAITKDTKKKNPSEIYTVLPDGQKEELSANEKAAVKTLLDRIDLNERASPLSNELIMERLGPDWCAALGLSGSTSSTKTSTVQSEDNEFDPNDF